MIDFELTEDHKALVQTVREFAQKEVAPYIKEWDEKQEVHPEILKKMGELNLLGVCIPEEYGGAGFDYISLGLVCEELEAVDTFLRVVMSVHSGLNSLTLLTWGSEEQKQRYLLPQSKGEKIATFGMTEPDAGSDVVALQSTARRDGKDYVLNGEKIWISLADVADHFLIIAWTDLEKKKQRDHKGLSAFCSTTESNEDFGQGRQLLLRPTRGSSAFRGSRSLTGMKKNTAWRSLRLRQPHLLCGYGSLIFILNTSVGRRSSRPPTITLRSIPMLIMLTRKPSM